MNKTIIMMTETIILHDVSIGYRTHRGVRTVAAGISAAIRAGELTCLLGRNGVGKSTLLRTLAAFQPPLAGTISVCGQPLTAYTPRQLARQIGIVLTERPDVWQMTVHDLVAMGRAPYTGFWGQLTDDDERTVSDAVSLVGISDLARRQVTTLSDGERQKVMIAKALAQQTPIIMLDEPTAFLDYPSKVDTLLLLQRISREQQKTVFLSTHDLELALQVADRLWLLEAGGLLHTGTPAELSAQGVLSRFVEQDGNARLDTETMDIKVNGGRR